MENRSYEAVTLYKLTYKMEAQILTTAFRLCRFFSQHQLLNIRLTESYFTCSVEFE